MPTLKSFVDFVSRERPAWTRSGSSLNMPERFSRESRMVTFVAHEHALSGGQNGVHTDHLLLALAENAQVGLLLQSSGVDIEQLRATVLSRQKADAVSYARDGVLPRTNFLHWAWHKAHDIADEESALLITPIHLHTATVRALQEFKDNAMLRVLGAGNS